MMLMMDEGGDDEEEEMRLMMKMISLSLQKRGLRCVRLGSACSTGVSGKPLLCPLNPKAVWPPVSKGLSAQACYQHD